jgi:hypothetical protein
MGSKKNRNLDVGVAMHHSKRVIRCMPISGKRNGLPEPLWTRDALKRPARTTEDALHSHVGNCYDRDTSDRPR